MARLFNTFSLADVTMLQHLQDSFAAQQHCAIAMFSLSSELLCKPAPYRHLQGEAERMLQPFLHFILLNPPQLEGLGLQDGNTVFASFFNGMIHRAIVPVLLRRQMMGAAQMIAVNKTDGIDLQHWKYILDGFAWNEVSYLAFLDAQPHAPLSDLVQNAALFQAQLVDLLDSEYRHSRKQSPAEEARLQPVEAKAELITNSRGDILNASDALVHLLRYENSSELVGLNAIAHLIIDSADQDETTGMILHHDGEMHRCVRVQTKDGYVLEITWNIQPEKDADGRNVGLNWCAVDAKPLYEPARSASISTESLPLETLEEDGTVYSQVRAAIQDRFKSDSDTSSLTGSTPQVEAEQEEAPLRKVPQEALSFLHNLKLPLFAIDPDGRILFWNKLLEQLLHIPAVAVIGMSFEHLLVDHSLKLWQQWLFDFRIDQNAVEFKPTALLHLLDNSGDAFALRLELTKNKVMEHLIISAIVASCEKTVLPLRSAPAPVSPPASPTPPPIVCQDHVNGALGTFIETLEKEWGALYASLQRLGGERSNDAAARELTAATLHSGENFSRLLQEIRYACGRIPLNKTAVNLVRLVRHATNTQITLFDRPLPIEWHIDDEGLLIEADLVVTFHALIYLLDYIRRTLTVETRLRVQIGTAPWPGSSDTINHKNPAVFLQISFEYPGASIPQTLEWSWPGTGTGDLALAAVHAIASAQGCDIKVTSGSQGKSTIRWFYPAARAKKKRLQQSTTVLVIEDEPGIVQMNTLMLEHAGYKVLAALTGTEGLKLLQSHETEIGAILLDWLLPDMTCEEMTEKIHAIATIPIIISSGFIPDAEMRRILDKYHAQFLQKPYTLATLARTVDNIMHGSD